MENNDIKEKLHTLGLSSEQASVYLTLLDHGYIKAGNIPKYTKIKRGLVYKILDQLIELKLVEKHGGEKSVARYSPLSPKLLQKFVEEKFVLAQEQQEIFDSIQGNLKSKFNLLSGKPSVQYFESIEGVKKMLEDSLHTENIMYTYADVDAVEKYFSQLNAEHSKARKEKKIKKLILVPNNKLGKKAEKQAIKDTLTDIRIIDKEYVPFGGVAEIYDNKIAYITVSDLGISGVLIEDKQISKMHKFIFEALWEKSKKETRKKED